jgi:hypothetical protein
MIIIIKNLPSYAAIFIIEAFDIVIMLFANDKVIVNLLVVLDLSPVSQIESIVC